MESLGVYLFGVIYLIILSVIDVSTFNNKKANIPSVITDVFLVISLVLGGKDSLYVGILASLFALFLHDISYFSGLADIKVLISSSFLIGVLSNFLIFLGVIMILGFIYKLIGYKLLHDENRMVPFLPIFFISFSLAYWVG